MTATTGPRATPQVTLGAPPPRLVPPAPPDDDEKYAYTDRNLLYLTTGLAVSAACLIVSQIRFEAHDPALWPFMVFTATYVIYQVISLPVNFTGRGFDLAAHQARVRAWHPAAYPSVDIYLPICGEPIEMLRNTWHAVADLIAGYPGPAQAYVLDDGPSDEARSAAESLGFCYVRRPDLRAYKKSGNLRYAFARTSGEYLVIFDADFAPRPDFLAETLPYMDDPAIAIVQTPQFFRASAAQTWIENAAGAIQEVFYRAIQVARDRFGAATCVGTSAVYRRAALEPHGGPTLIPYAEDVHTGLDVRSGRLVPGLPADRALDRHLPGQPRRVRAAAVPVVHRERRHRLLPPAVVHPDEHPGPAHLHIRVLLLRLHRPALLLRAASSPSSCWRSCPARSGCGTSSSSPRP